MNVDQTLHDELATVARSIVTPPPPAVADLVRQAEREQTRARRTIVVSGLVAAAVVGAVLLGNQLAKTDASPTPAPQPTRTPTTFQVGAPLKTWIDENGTFYLDDTKVNGKDWAGAVTSGDLTTVAEGPYDTGTVGVFLGSVQVDSLHAVAVPEIAVSPDHRTIAWIGFEDKARRNGALIVARVDDTGVTESGHLSTGRQMVYSDQGPRERILALADDGTVTYGGDSGGGYTWKPGGVPAAADVAAYRNGAEGFPVTGAEDLQMNATHTWGAWTTDAVSVATDASDALYTSVAFQRTGDPGSRGKLEFAGRFHYVNVVGWESDTDLIVYADPQATGAARYLRCSVTDLTCEYAPVPK